MSACILVVDKEKANRAAIIRVLKGAGYKILQAENGQECLRLAHKHHPEMILMAVHLPDSSGMDICRQIKVEGVLKDILIVMLSTIFTKREETGSEFEPGADGYITRPFSNYGLLAQVDAMLRIKTAENAFKEREKRFRLLVENSTDAITLLDTKGKVVYDSPAAPGMLGYDAQEWLGKNIFKLIHADDLKNVKAQFNSLILTRGARAQSIFRLRHKNKSWVWIDAVATNLLDDPDLNAIVVNYHDITERVQAEARLLESEERYRQFINLSLAPIYIFDPRSKKILETNLAFDKLLGYTSEESKNLTDYDVVAHERKSADHFTRQVLSSGPADIGERQWRCKDGTNVSMLVTANKIKVKDDDIIFVTAHNITERKKTEEALRNREQHLKAIIENEPECIKLVAPDGILLQMNPAGLAMIEADDEQSMLGKSIYPIVATEYRQAFRDLTDRVNKGESGKLEFEIVGLKGTHRWLDTHAVPMRNEHGDVIGSLGITRDITERKQAEDTLRRVEENYRNIFHNSLNGIFQSTPEGRYILANSAMARILGYDSPEELLSNVTDTALQVYANPGSRAEHTRLLKEQGGNVIGFEYQAYRKDGSTVWVSENARSVMDSNGVLLYYEGAVEDISERKLAEEKLLESEKQYRELYSNMPAMFFTINAEGTTLSVNTFGAEQLGYTEAELVGKSVLQVFHEEDKQQALLHVKDCLEHPQQTFQWELRKVRKNGNILWVKETAWAVINQQGKLIVLIVCEDITERKLAREIVRKSEQRYRALFEDMPVAIWEEDFSEVKKYMDSLKEQGVKDFRAYFKSNPEGFLECASMVKVLDINQATLKMYHADSKEDLYKSIDKGLTKSEKEQIYDALLAISEGKSDHTWEGFDETITGEPIEISLSWSVAPGYETDFSKVIVTTIDITERKQAEESLRTSEEKYRLIIENAGEALYVTQNGLIVFINPMFEKIADLPASELIGKTVLNFIPAFEDRVAALKNHQRILRGKILNARREYKVRLHSGMERWIDMNEVRTTWEGKLATLTFATDITDRKRQEREQEALASVTQALNQGLDLDLLLKNLLDAALHAIPAAEKGTILLSDAENRLKIRALSGYLDPRVSTAIFPSTSGYSARAVAERQPLIIADARAEGPIRYDLEIEEMGQVQSAIVAPLIVNGRAIGAIALDNASRKEAFSEVELAMLSTFASSAALVIQNTRLFEETSQRVAELELLYQSGLTINQLLQPKEIAQKMINLLDQKMGWHHAAIRLYHPEDETLELVAFHQTHAENNGELINLEERFNKAVSHANQGFSGWVVQHSQSVRTGDLKNDPRYAETFPGLQSGLYMPIKIGDFVLGVISIESEKENAFSESDERLTATLAAQAASALENARLFQESRQHTQELEQRVEERTRQVQQTYLILQETSTYNQRILDNSPIGIAAYHNTGECAFTNIALEKMLDAPPGKMLELNFRQNPKWVETGMLASAEAALFTGLQQQIEVHTISSFGKEVWLDFTFVSFENNQEAHLLLMAEDISERKRAEQRLLELSTEIEDLYNNAPCGYHSIDIEKRFVLVNNTLLKWLGYQRHELIGKRFEDLLTEASLPIFHKNFQSLQEHEDTYDQEMELLCKDGRILPVSLNSSAVFDENGNFVRTRASTFDISYRRIIEQSLRESESYARLLFNAAPAPVSVWEVGGLMLDVNTVFERQHGVSREQAHGRNIRDLGIFPQEEMDKADDYVAGVMAEDNTAPIELKFYAPGDGAERTLELHSYPITVQGKNLILSTSRDITTHKQAEETLRLANTEMERALRVKNEFLANMSHELRTPLNAILGISESLEEQIAGALNDKQIKYVNIIKESGRHLLALINDILDLSKIEAGRMEFEMHKVSVDLLCKSSMRMVKELAQKKSLNVSFEIKGDVKVILADERRLKQSLVNLFSNAVKFTPDGKEIGLEVSGHPELNEVTFTVWDQGVGIAEENIKRLFKPFVQLDAGLAREYQGTGLGLALVAQMINLQGGHVRIESKLGEGSRFIITLPWPKNMQTSQATITAELSPPSQRPQEKHIGKILLVEDTEVVIQLVNDYLLFKGYEVIIARNGMEAVQMAAQQRPDLILMDVMMPVMDGLEATKQIRKDKTLQNVPIIALTALAMSGDEQRCLNAGMNDYMSKPIQMQALGDMIEKYLQAAREK